MRQAWMKTWWGCMAAAVLLAGCGAGGGTEPQGPGEALVSAITGPEGEGSSAETPESDAERFCAELRTRCLEAGGDAESCELRYQDCLRAPPPPPPPEECREHCGVELAGCIRAGVDSTECLTRFGVCMSGQQEPPPPPPTCDEVRDECLRAGGTREQCEERYRACQQQQPPPPPLTCDEVRAQCQSAGGTPEQCELRYQLCQQQQPPRG